MDLEESKGKSVLSKTLFKILDISEQASKLLLKYYKQKIAVEFKEGDSFNPVTQADKESDHLIRSLLSSFFPGDLILSEENLNIPTNFNGRVWMVDPLDGTKEFIAETDAFSISIGLWENGRIVLGVVNMPARKHLFYAEIGKGSYRQINGEAAKMTVSDVEELSQVRLITKNSSKEIRLLDKKVDGLKVAERVPEGSTGAKLCKIASGEAEVFVNTNFRNSKWDTAAPQLILEEAGGIITNLDGDPLDYTQPEVVWRRSFVAANNRKIHNQIITSLQPGD